MNSVTSTDSPALRPWQFFVLAGLLAATVGVLASGPSTAPVLVLTSLTIGAAATAGIAFYRTLWPLLAPELAERGDSLGRRTREAMEREKMLVLRSIKELEFDHAMGKLSDGDSRDMSARLRSRAISLMKQLDEGTNIYRDMLERDLAARLDPAAAAARVAAALAPKPSAATVPSPASEPAAEAARPECPSCLTVNDADARFCKGCGQGLDEARGGAA